VNDKIAIIGAGPLASILAHRIPTSVRKVIIGRPKAAAVALADEVGGIASDQASAVRGCRVVFLAVPTPDVAQALADIRPHLSPEALVVNTAVDVPTADLADDRLHVGAAKIIGHPQELEQGARAVVVLDHVGPADAELLTALLADLGPVIRGDERTVEAAARALSEVLAGARDELRRRLAEAGLPADVVPAAIAAAAPGVLRAMALSEDNAAERGIRRHAGAGETAASRVSH
jgi:pyrroline-5-carboxylate reductase